MVQLYGVITTIYVYKQLIPHPVGKYLESGDPARLIPHLRSVVSILCPGHGNPRHYQPCLLCGVYLCVGPFDKFKTGRRMVVWV
jgi:hypothetical protein